MFLSYVRKLLQILVNAISHIGLKMKYSDRILGQYMAEHLSKILLSALLYFFDDSAAIQ
jgi:hypothetical protein